MGRLPSAFLLATEGGTRKIGGGGASLASKTTYLRNNNPPCGMIPGSRPPRHYPPPRPPALHLRRSQSIRHRPRPCRQHRCPRPRCRCHLPRKTALGASKVTALRHRVESGAKRGAPCNKYIKNGGGGYGRLGSCGAWWGQASGVSTTLPLGRAEVRGRLRVGWVTAEQNG